MVAQKRVSLIHLNFGHSPKTYLPWRHTNRAKNETIQADLYWINICICQYSSNIGILLEVKRLSHQWVKGLSKWLHVICCIFVSVVLLCWIFVLLKTYLSFFFFSKQDSNKENIQPIILAGGQRKMERWRSSLLTEQVAVFVKRESLGKFSVHLRPKPAVMYPQLSRETLSTHSELTLCFCSQLPLSLHHTCTLHTVHSHCRKWRKHKVCRVGGRGVIGCHSWNTSHLRHSRWRERRLSLYWVWLWTDARFAVPLGYSSLSIGGIERRECNKSFNGGPTKSYSVDFKDS